MAFHVVRDDMAHGQLVIVLVSSTFAMEDFGWVVSHHGPWVMFATLHFPLFSPPLVAD